MNTFTNADYIGQYVKIRDFVDAKRAEFEESIKPYKEAMSTIEYHMMNVLNEMDDDADGDKKASIATSKGTCFRKNILSVKVADRDSFMNFVFNGHHDNFITNAVSKEAVSEYMEAHKAAPPGIEITRVRKVQFNAPRG